MEADEELCLLASIRELYQPGVTDMRVLLTTELDKVVAHAKDTLMAKALSCKGERITVETGRNFFHSHDLPITMPTTVGEDHKVETVAGLPAASNETGAGTEAEVETEAQAEATTEAEAEAEADSESETKTGPERETDTKKASSDVEAETEAQQQEGAARRTRPTRIGRPRRTSSMTTVEDEGEHQYSLVTMAKRRMTGDESSPHGEDGSSPATTIESSPVKKLRRSSRK